MLFIAWGITVPADIRAATFPPWENLGVSLSAAPVYEFESSLTDGSKLDAFRIFFDASGRKNISDAISIGLRFAYDYKDFHFTGPGTSIWSNPWNEVHRLELNSSVAYNFSPDWSLIVAPSIQFSRAGDAGWGNALAYGGVVTVSKVFTPDLTLGIGAGSFNQLEAITAFPMIAVNWRITERLLLTNPLRPGPTGPAGLELVYSIGDGWDAGFGGAYRMNRFRLSRTGTLSDTIGESSSIPAWLRITKSISNDFYVDLYGGASLSGQMNIDDQNGHRFTSTRVNPAPFLCLALSARF